MTIVPTAGVTCAYGSEPATANVYGVPVCTDHVALADMTALATSAHQVGIGHLLTPEVAALAPEPYAGRHRAGN